MNNDKWLDRSGERRSFLKNGLLFLAGATTCRGTLLANKADSLRIGLLTDLHYADKPATGTRHYRDTLIKLDDAAKEFTRSDLSFLVELGDLIDAADSVDTELSWLSTINEKFSAISARRHYVLGNHCVDTLTKEEFLSRVGQEKSWYSFDQGDTHFVVLDACFRSDGKPYGRKNFTWTDTLIPPEELEWLQADLRSTSKYVIVFAHQRLDVSNNHGVRNNVQVRTILEGSGRVLAVFQGHSHQNDLKEINGIHYCTLVAMVEGTGRGSSGYSILEVQTDGTLIVTGFVNQKSHQLATKAR
jgi:hypothetical protein